MVFDETLPLPMRNNNPGALLSCAGVDYPTERNGGLAVFRTRSDGLLGLAVYLHNLYQHYALRSMQALLGQHVKERDVDLVLYIKRVCQHVGMNPLLARTSDLRLDQAWRMADLMRAISRTENDIPPAGWPSFPEWVSVSEVTMALIDARRWTTV